MVSSRCVHVGLGGAGRAQRLALAHRLEVREVLLVLARPARTEAVADQRQVRQRPQSQPPGVDDQPRPHHAPPPHAGRTKKGRFFGVLTKRKREENEKKNGAAGAAQRRAAPPQAARQVRGYQMFACCAASRDSQKGGV